MSSGFVSGGTSDAPIERSDEWLAAELELEASRRRKADEAAAANSGRSLFETLEANKAAKQEAFEEANKLKNQFRALDDDEIDFLDSVLQSTRNEEARIKKETREGLEAFRKRQQELDKVSRETEAGETDLAAPEDEWTTAGRKRKRTKEGVLKGIKLRKASTGDSTAEKQTTSPETKETKQTANAVPISEVSLSEANHSAKHPDAKELISKPRSAAGKSPDSQPEKQTEAKAGLGLVDYGSDDDEW